MIYNENDRYGHFFFFLELLHYDKIQKRNYGISYLILRMAD